MREESPREPLRIGVVVAVRNEARSIGELLGSLETQRGLERVCCIAAADGRSEDDTRAILESWKARLPALRVLDNPLKIAPAGFNVGIRACLEAGAGVVLVVSGHSAMHEGFLAELERVLRSSDAAIVGCILDYPPPKTVFDRASQAFVESRLGRRLRVFSKQTDVRETPIATFPAVRREVFDRIGFFDESMVRNQDIEFTERARAAGFRIVTSPGMRCLYHPPKTLRHLVRQMYGNGVWVGRRPDAHGIRHLAPALFFAALLVSAPAGVAKGGAWPWIPVGLGGLYLLGIFAVSAAWTREIGAAVFWLPVAFAASHVAYALGTFRGLLSRRAATLVPRAVRRDATSNP